MLQQRMQAVEHGFVVAPKEIARIILDKIALFLRVNARVLRHHELGHVVVNQSCEKIVPAEL